MRTGTPLTRYAYPEDLYGDDADVARVKRLALRCGRTWPRAGQEGKEARATALAALDAALARCSVPQVRYFAVVTLLDGRFNGATGEGAYISVASRLCNERAWADLRRRGDAWREKGLGSFALVEAVEEAGL